MFHLRNFILVGVLIWCIGVMGQEPEQYEKCTTIDGFDGICISARQCRLAGKDERLAGELPVCDQMKDSFKDIVCCLDDPIYLPHVISEPLENDNENNRTRLRPGDIANKMCKIYSRYTYERDPLMTAFGEYIEHFDCEIYNNELLRTLSTVARIKEFPHMVQIGYGTASDKKWLCAGSLISENYILTAAKCVNNSIHGDPKFVRENPLKIINSTYWQNREIAEIILPPNYPTMKNQSLILLKVKTKFDLNVVLRPACLYTKDDAPQGKLVSAGWNLTENIEEGGANLNRVYLQPLPEDKCNDNNIANFNLQGVNKNDSICTKAGSNVGDGNICNVDIGGPLLQFHPIYKDLKCMHDIIGVKLDDTDCQNGKKGINVYAKVYDYIKWIEDTVWHNVTI